MVQAISANHTGANHTGANKADANRAGANHAGANKAGANQTGSNQAGANHAGVNKAGANQTGTNQAGAKQAGMDRIAANEAGAHEGVPRLPLIVGGRSSGARVACRTATTLGAAGVLCLAFPLHPPGKPEKSRAGELPVGVPTLVLNGDRDPFGVPLATADVEVVVRAGATHDLRKDVNTTAELAVGWLRRHGWAH
nr:alpha/beta family hydrolase [Actinoplanes deccanensis]